MENTDILNYWRRIGLYAELFPVWSTLKNWRNITKVVAPKRKCSISDFCTTMRLHTKHALWLSIWRRKRLLRFEHISLYIHVWYVYKWFRHKFWQFTRSLTIRIYLPLLSYHPTPFSPDLAPCNFFLLPNLNSTYTKDSLFYAST